MFCLVRCRLTGAGTATLQRRRTSALRLTAGKLVYETAGAKDNAAPTLLFYLATPCAARAWCRPRDCHLAEHHHPAPLHARKQRQDWPRFCVRPGRRCIERPKSAPACQNGTSAPGRAALPSCYHTNWGCARGRRPGRAEGVFGTSQSRPPHLSGQCPKHAGPRYFFKGHQRAARLGHAGAAANGDVCLGRRANFTWPQVDGKRPK